MNDVLDLSRLRALRKEKPDTVMGLVRLAWPDIKAALDRGHSLRVVQGRLVEAGIPVEYRQLSVYIGRIERQHAALTPSPASPTRAEAPTKRPSPTKPKLASSDDPLANVRDRTGTPAGFHFDDEPADESKLI